MSNPPSEDKITCSSPLTSDVSEKSPSEKSEVNINQPSKAVIRMYATVLMLLSTSSVSLLLQSASSALFGYGKQTFIATGLLIVSAFFAIFVYEWLRLHGSRLTRRIRPQFNIRSLLDTHQEFQRNRIFDATRMMMGLLDEFPQFDPSGPRTPDVDDNDVKPEPIVTPTQTEKVSQASQEGLHRNIKE